MGILGLVLGVPGGSLGSMGILGAFLGGTEASLGLSVSATNRCVMYTMFYTCFCCGRFVMLRNWNHRGGVNSYPCFQRLHVAYVGL